MDKTYLNGEFGDVNGESGAFEDETFLDFEGDLTPNPYATDDTPANNYAERGSGQGEGEDNSEAAGDNSAGEADQVPLTAEELAKVREQLFDARQNQMKMIETQHQQRLAELAAQERLINARIQQQPQKELNEFERAVQEEVNKRVQQSVTPEIQQIRQQMQQQQMATAVQSTLQAGLSAPDMPNFDQVTGIAITKFGNDVVMRKIMNSSPQESARWLYNLGLAEARATQSASAGQVHAVPVQQTQVKQAPVKAALPRGMNVQGGAAGMSDADWGTLDKKIDNMSREQLNEFKKNPKNLALFNRMLEFGTTNPRASLPRE